MEIRLNIVVVEDHDALRENIVELLTLHGHRVLGVADAESVDDEAAREPIDVLVADLNLPGEDGLSLTRRLRAAQPQAQIILCTARTAVDDRVKGYEHGADLYLTKPFAPAELLAAIQASGRRVAAMRDRSPVTFKLHSRSLRLEGRREQAPVTPEESTLLAAFARAPGGKLATWQIAEILRSDPDSFSKTAVEMRIYRLRRKLESLGAEPDCLRAARGHGYMLCVPLVVL